MKKKGGILKCECYIVIYLIMFLCFCIKIIFVIFLEFFCKNCFIWVLSIFFMGKKWKKNLFRLKVGWILLSDNI